MQKPWRIRPQALIPGPTLELGGMQNPVWKLKIPAALPTPTTASQRANKIIVITSRGSGRQEWFQLVIHFPRPEAGRRRPARGLGQRRQRVGAGPLAWPGVSCAAQPPRGPASGALFSCPARAVSQAVSQAQPARSCTLVLPFFSPLLEGGAQGSLSCLVPARPSLQSARFPAS